MTKLLTKQDIREIIIEVNVTQTELFRQEFNKIYTILAQHDRRFNEVEEKLYSGITSLRNEINQFKNVFMGEIKGMRDELSVFKDDVTGAIHEMTDEVAVLVGYKDDIEDHGVRIEKLEQKVFPAKN